jgi:CRP-like cAMP-binding protein
MLALPYHLIRAEGIFGADMSAKLQVLIRKLKEHSRLTSEDAGAIIALSHSVRELKPNEDLVRQGDDPEVSAVVLSGMLARYHLLDTGTRQYLSFHLAGDMPESQSLFIEKMDHAVCAIGPAVVACVPHHELIAAFKRWPSVGFAIWRETLIDAAIFREAITNNSARSKLEGMAHLFCEFFYRARATGLTNGNTFVLPLSLIQLGETLGMSIATVNRTLLDLRATRAADLQRGLLEIKNWERLVALAQFNPSYLHQKRPPL